jgi:MraZ protein
MFRGRYEHSVDAKGRIAFPVRFREELGEDERLVVTMHLSDPCLLVYPLKEWEAFEERLSKLPQLDPKVTMLRRMYLGRAHELVLDKQGRLLLPLDLRRDASIDRDAVWSGAARYSELWSKQNYDQHLEAVQKKLAGGELQDTLEKLAGLGI